MTEPLTPPAIDIPQGGPRAMVEQACAMAIQDAVAYLRNTETISAAAIGAAEEIMLRSAGSAERGDDGAAVAVATAQAALAAAVAHVEQVSALVSRILRDFPLA
jgi:hypothetical protein